MKNIIARCISKIRKLIITTQSKNVIIGKDATIKKSSTIKCYGTSASIYIKDSCCICENNHITCLDEGSVDIGSNVFFNRNCTIVARCHITIGDHTLFGPSVMIYDHDHSFDFNQVYNTFNVAPVIIDNDCWIGAGTIILRGTHIGAHSIIGAGSIIKGIIPPHSIVKSDTNVIIEEICHDH